ncbi:MAG: tetratricopeptide repeat protein [Terracidiphilus sp.]
MAARANAARDDGRLDEAVTLFHRALALNPRWAEGWWSLGTIDYDNDQNRAAADAFKRVVALDPKQGTARAMLGLCEFELGQDASALQDIEASKNLGILEDPQLRQVVLYHEGVLLQRSGRFEGAQKALSSLCLSGVNSEELTETYGLTVLHLRDAKPPAPGTQESDIVEHLGRGACLGGQKNYDAARLEYELVIRQYPHFPLVYYAYGELLLAARDRAAAIEEFQQEIAEQPDSTLARLQIAAAEYKVDSAAGLPYAEEAVRIAPQAPFAHYVLGLLLLDTGAYEKAIPHLEIARKAFPQETKIDWSLGVAYAHAGRPQEAAQARAAFAHLNQATGRDSESGSPGETPDAGPQIEIPDGPATAAGH